MAEPDVKKNLPLSGSGGVGALVGSQQTIDAIWRGMSPEKQQTFMNSSRDMLAKSIEREAVGTIGQHHERLKELADKVRSIDVSSATPSNFMATVSKVLTAEDVKASETVKRAMELIRNAR
jgi:hypothetical protein